MKHNRDSPQITRLGAKRPKGFGESFPHAPQGLSRSDWGLNEKNTQCEAQVAKVPSGSGNPNEFEPNIFLKLSYAESEHTVAGVGLSWTKDG